MLAQLFRGGDPETEEAFVKQVAGGVVFMRQLRRIEGEIVNLRKAWGG